MPDQEGRGRGLNMGGGLSRCGVESDGPDAAGAQEPVAHEEGLRERERGGVGVGFTPRLALTRAGGPCWGQTAGGAGRKTAREGEQGNTTTVGALGRVNPQMKAPWREE